MLQSKKVFRNQAKLSEKHWIQFVIRVKPCGTTIFGEILEKHYVEAPKKQENTRHKYCNGSKEYTKII